MSQENVELVRRAYAVFDKDLDRLLALLDGAVEWVSPRDAIEPGVRHGHQGVRDAFAATAMAWDEARDQTLMFGGQAPGAACQDDGHRTCNVLWTWTGEFTAACTRLGKMPAMFQSYAAPGLS